MAERSSRTSRARVRPSRYVAPGTLCILRHRDAVLMLEGAPRKRWAGRLAGIGGGVQPGETPIRAALREIFEETGLRLRVGDVRVKGVVHSQSFYGESKFMVVLVARAPHRRVRSGDEGRLRWVPLRGLAGEPNVIPDLYTLIPRVLALGPGELLSGVFVYDGKDTLLSLELTTVRS